MLPLLAFLQGPDVVRHGLTGQEWGSGDHNTKDHVPDTMKRVPAVSATQTGIQPFASRP